MGEDYGVLDEITSTRPFRGEEVRCAGLGGGGRVVAFVTGGIDRVETNILRLYPESLAIPPPGKIVTGSTLPKEGRKWSV